MDQLPKEILLNEVLLKLSSKDILNACIANKSFQKLCKDEHLWFQLLERDFSNDFSLFQKENLSSRDLYKLLYGLQVVKKFINEKTRITIKSLYELYHLEDLDLYSNKLTSIPKEFGLLSNLQIFHLYNNKLTSIPKEIGALKSLQVFNLDINRLTSIPAEIGNLRNLERLHLSYNLLREIPKELGYLQKLKILDLENNQLTTFPKEILDLLPGLTIFQ